jgi:Flp pilus assembly pilin Flp
MRRLADKLLKRFYFIKRIFSVISKEMKVQRLTKRCEPLFLYLQKSPTLNQGGETMRRLSKKGQSTLEYILVWTAVVAALVVAATGTQLRGHITNAIDNMGNKIENEATSLSDGLRQ